MGAPTSALRLAGADALAADTNSLADAVGLKVHLIKADFDPGNATDFTTLTEATFTGSTAKAATAGAQTSGWDPERGAPVIILKEPAGGWTWECTADPASPETIYGIAVTDNTSADTLWSEKLATPVTIAAAGDIVSLGQIRMYPMASNWS